MRPFLIAGLTGLLCLSIHVTAHAETEEERKAIEEIERKAEAEKKKALEKIRKKAEAEKKKAVAEAKKEEAKRKREEAEAKKKAEREAKKQEAQRKKAEAEAKKRGEPPPPPPAEAPPVTPEVVPPPAPAPAAPPPEPLPEAKPVDNAGGARWTGIGFVQQGEATPGQQSAAGGAGALEVPPAMGALGMNRGYFMFGLGRARFNPINDGTTDDDTAFSLLDLNLRLGFEFRNLGSLLAPWFDLGPNLMFGSREETNPSTEREAGERQLRELLVRVRHHAWTDVRPPRALPHARQAGRGRTLLRRRGLRLAQGRVPDDEPPRARSCRASRADLLPGLVRDASRLVRAFRAR